ncbi:MAG TPA: anthranilate synthase component I family protein, partial [Ferruginibacter sp.]|nr:anthranilate synthase component I family protein [Ferruginibacter sp.]
MNTICFTTSYKKILADIFTPVGIYLRLRDKFRDTILLESTDFHAGENSYSIIGINAIAGIEVINKQSVEYKFPAGKPQKLSLQNRDDLTMLLQQFTNSLQPTAKPEPPVHIAQSLFGYTAYDAIPFFEQINFNKKKLSNGDSSVPLMRYRLYQYVIIINHFKDEMFICENHFEGLESRLADVESLIKGKDVPVFPFALNGAEQNNMTDEA